MASSKERLARELHYTTPTMDPQQPPMSLRVHAPEIVSALLSDGVDVRLRLSGHSMKPLLRTGSVVSFSGRPTPGRGDIVLLRFPNGRHAKLVAHRVVSMSGDDVYTQGDSSTTSDPPVPRSEVLGTAVSLDIGGLSLPLRNVPMRSLGLLMSRVYPPLVRAFRSLVPRKDALRCAS